MIRKLEIGPGAAKIDSSWDTIGDFTREGVVDQVCHWGEDRIPHEDETFDYVYASHCLEHVPWYNVKYALDEAYRVLKTDGILEIHVPDFGYLVQCYLERKNGDNWHKFNNQEHYLSWVNSRVFSYGPTLSNYHKCAFDEEYLTFCLERSMFTDIIKIEKSLAHNLHGNINLGLRSRKS